MSAAVALLKRDDRPDHRSVQDANVDNARAAQGAASETLLFLKPVPLPDGTPRRPRKRIEIREDGTLAAAKGTFRLKTFSGELVTVAGLHALHEVIRSRAVAGETVLVAGLPPPRADLRRMRRTSAVIADRESRIIMGDVDGLPNYRLLDPAADPEGAAESMRGLMPPSLRLAAVSAAFSSSTGLAGGVPATLSLHLRAWGSRGMGEDERVAVVRALHRYVTARLTEIGVEPTGKLDHALARPEQMQSIAAPEMPDGHPDPFSRSSRHVLLEGEDSFSVEALLEELAPFLAETPRPSAKPGKTPSEAGRRGGPLVQVPETAVAGLAAPAPDDALPVRIRLALEENAGFRAAQHRAGATRTQAARQVSAARSVLDLVRWARARAAWGRTVPALAAWHRAGGVPEGLRDEFMVVLHSRLGYALQGRGIDGGDFADALAAVAVPCVGRAWFEEEWLGEGFHGSVTRRLARSRAGERVEWEGAFRAPLYWHRKDTVRRTLGIGEAEAELLGLASLVERTAQVRMRRRAEGAKSTDAVESEAATLRLKARRLRGRGFGLAAVAAACGRSETWARMATAGMAPARGGDDRITGGIAAITTEIPTETPGTRGARDDRDRSRCVTSKGRLTLDEDGYSQIDGAYPTRSELRNGTPDSQSPGTPGAVAVTTGPERDASSIAAGRRQEGGSADAAVVALPEPPRPRSGLVAAPEPYPLPTFSAAPASWDARVSVPQGPMPRFGGWDWKGRAAQRGGHPVWISGAGVVVSMGTGVGGDVPAWAVQGITAAREAALAPRREALRALDSRARRDAGATAADLRYREWLTEQGRGDPAIVVPPEPDDRTVAGTPSWLAEGRCRVIRALRRRDWRAGLEFLRRTEPLLVGAVVSYVPCSDEEKAAYAEGLAKAAARAERRRADATEDATAGGKNVSRAPSVILPTAPRPAGKRFRTERDGTDLRAWASASLAA